MEISPLWTIIKTSSGMNHIVAQISAGDGAYGMGMYYDSYEALVKSFDPSQPIQSQYALNINLPKMPNSYLIQLNKKDGTKEFAVALPATNESALIDKTLNTGVQLPTVNNGQNVDWANVMPRFVINEE